MDAVPFGVQLMRGYHVKSTERRPWEPMRLEPVGHVSDVIQQGGGKLTLVGGDPGESRKEKGTDMG